MTHHKIGERAIFIVMQYYVAFQRLLDLTGDDIILLDPGCAGDVHLCMSCATFAW